MDKKSSKYVNLESTPEVVEKLEQDWIARTLESARNGKDIIYMPHMEHPVNKPWVQVKPGDIIRIESEWARPMIDADKPMMGNMFDHGPEYKTTVLVKDISGTQHGVFVECLNGDIITSLNLAKACRSIQQELENQRKDEELQKDLAILEQSAKEFDKFGKGDTMKLCNRLDIEIAMVDMPTVLPLISKKAKEIAEEMKINQDYKSSMTHDKLYRSLAAVYSEYKIEQRNQENGEIVDKLLSKNKKIVFVPQSTQLLDCQGRFIENSKIKKGQLISLTAQGVDLTKKSTDTQKGLKTRADAVVLDVHITNKGSKYPSTQKFAIETPDCIYISCPHLAKAVYQSLYPTVQEARRHNTEIHASQKHLTEFLSTQKHGEIINEWSGPILDTYEPMSAEELEKWEMQRQEYFDSKQSYFKSVFKSCFDENIPIIIVPGDFTSIGITTDSLINSNSQLTAFYPNMGESVWIPSDAKIFNSDTPFQETESVVCCATYLDANEHWVGYGILTDDGLIISSDLEKTLVLAHQEYVQEHSQELPEQYMETEEIETQTANDPIIGYNR